MDSIEARLRKIREELETIQLEARQQVLNNTFNQLRQVTAQLSNAISECQFEVAEHERKGGAPSAVARGGG